MCKDTALQMKFVASDSSGNQVSFVSRMTIQDTKPPVFFSPPTKEVAEYARNARSSSDDLAAWLELHGKAKVSDAFPATVTWNHSALSFQQTKPESACLDNHAEVTFTASDGCGNSADAHGMFSFVDSQPPSVVAWPKNMTLALGSSETPALIQDWLQTHGGAQVEDENSVYWPPVVPNLVLMRELKSSKCLDATANILFKVEDACGHVTGIPAVLQTLDRVAPEIIVAASNITMYGTGTPVNHFDQWLNGHAGALAAPDDVSLDVTWSYSTAGMHPIAPTLPTISCPNRRAQVDFLVSDDCGNTAITSAWYAHVEEACVVDAYAQNVSVRLNRASNNRDLQQWLHSNGGAVVQMPPGARALGNLSWSHSGVAQTSPVGRAGDVIIATAFTAEDPCGNTVALSGTFHIMDDVPPLMLHQAESLVVEDDGNGNAQDFSQWLASSGGANASDESGNVTWTHTVTNEIVLQRQRGLCIDKRIWVTFAASDQNGNAVETTANFTILDRVAPRFDILPMDVSVEADGAGNSADLGRWLSNNGGAQVTDAARTVLWNRTTTGFEPTDPASQCTDRQTTYSFTPTDACGNSAVAYTATFSIVDTAPPFLQTLPRSVDLDADGTGNKKEIATWLEGTAGAQATDLEGPVTWTHTNDVSFSERRIRWCTPVKKIVVFTATDLCQNSVNVTAKISMSDTASPRITKGPENVTVGLAGGAVTISNNTVERRDNENTHKLQAWIDSAGGAKFTDLDPATLKTGHGATLPGWTSFRSKRGPSCVGQELTLNFSSTDECGNTVQAPPATFAVEDLTPPRVISPSKNGSSALRQLNNANNAKLTMWLANHGWAVAQDIDTPSAVMWSHTTPVVIDPPLEKCGNQTILVDFVATDGCGNAVATPGRFDLFDKQPPTLAVLPKNAAFNVAGLLKGAGGNMKSIRACSQVDTLSLRAGNREVCGGSKFHTQKLSEKYPDSPKICFRRATYQKTGRICAHAGARLCTADELLNQVAFKTGCEGDAARTWTSTACTTAKGIAGRLSVKGGGPPKDKLQPKCWPLLNNARFNGTALIRCCGDRVPADEEQQVCGWARLCL